MTATPPSSTSSGAVAPGAELWLLRVGAPDELDACLARFAGTELEAVLCPPGGEEERWAAAFAAAHGARLERRAELARASDRGAEHEHGTRAWAPLEACLARGGGSALALLPHETLLAAVARALALSARGAAALRVDPARAVLLRRGQDGIALRRTNARAPERESGSALPGASGASGAP